jgi:hypothetical protein
MTVGHTLRHAMPGQAMYDTLLVDLLCCRCLGASHFYVYDHNSTQPLLSDIWHYVQQGVVTYTYFKGWGMDPRA